MLCVDELLPQLVKLTIFIFKISLSSSALLAASNSLLHFALHVLDKLGQLSVVLILLLKTERKLSVISLHLVDDSISLLLPGIKQAKTMQADNGGCPFIPYSDVAI